MCSIGSGGGSGERGGAAPAGRAAPAPGAGPAGCCAATDAVRLPATRKAKTTFVFISRLPRPALLCAQLRFREVPETISLDEASMQQPSFSAPDHAVALLARHLDERLIAVERCGRFDDAGHVRRRR